MIYFKEISYEQKTKRVINLFFIALLLMVVVISRPVIKKEQQSIVDVKYSLLIAIDVSQSMYAEDISPNRYLFAVSVIKKLLKKAVDFDIGFIAFSDNSYMLSPPTGDFESLEMILKNSNFRNNSNGTNLKNLIKEVSVYFDKENENNNLLIISDGSDQKNFEDEIQLAKKYNIKISNINIATSALSPIPKKSFSLTASKYLQDKTGHTVFVTKNNNFDVLAVKTGGVSITYPFGIQDIKFLLQKLRDQKMEKGDESRKIQYIELYYYPLWIVFVLLYFLLFSPSSLKNIKLILLASLLFHASPQEASVLDFIYLDRADEALKNKEYEKAIFNYKKLEQTDGVLYNIATLEYQLTHYKKALKIYYKIRTKDRELLYRQYFNMGNCSFKMQKYYEAKSYFMVASKLKRTVEITENLELVKSLIKKRKYSSKKNTNEDRIYVCVIKESKEESSEKQKKSAEETKAEPVANKEITLEQPIKQDNKNEIAW